MNPSSANRCPRALARSRGLSLIEVAVSMAVLAVAAFGVAASMMTSIAGTRRYQMNTIVVARAQHYLETLYNLQVGVSGDAAASTANLELVFSGNPELGEAPPTLMSLAKAIDAKANDLYEFEPPELGFAGTFRVRVSNNVVHTLDLSSHVDSNGDGSADDGSYTMADTTVIEQVANGGCFVDDDDDDGRELFCFDVWFVPAQPEGATPTLVFRGFRSQDP